MMFPVDKDSFEIGGKVLIPHSFLEKKSAGTIVSKTHVGIAVIHETTPPVRGFYSYTWLNETYGPPNDKLPLNL